MDLSIYLLSNKSGSPRADARHDNRTVPTRTQKILARHGSLRRIISDNVPQFKLAADTIDKI